MKRLVVVLVPLSILISGCSFGIIKAPTRLSDKGAVFNADVYSNIDGDTDYSWGIGFENGGGGTSTRTVKTVNGQPSAVSTPFTILDPDTAYHLTLCTQDHGENPPRQVCTKATDFRTPPAGGRSGIAFVRGGLLWVMDADGANKARDSQHLLSREPLLPDLVARWDPPRVHPGRRHPDHQGGRLLPHPADHRPRHRFRARLVARRQQDRLHLLPHRPAAGLGDGRQRIFPHAAHP